MDYSKIKFREKSAFENVRIALINFLAQKIDEIEKNQTNHFVEKGYQKNEIQTECILKFTTSNRFVLVVVSFVKVHPEIALKEEIQKYAEMRYLRFEKNVNYSKELNEAIQLLENEAKEQVHEKMKTVENDFLQISVADIESLKKSDWSGLNKYLQNSLFYKNLLQKPVVNIFSERFELSPKMENHFSSLEKYFFQKQQEKNEVEAKKKEQAEREEKAYKQMLKNWATDEGSEFLQLRIKHEKNWFEIAQTEYWQKQFDFEKYENTFQNQEDCSIDDYWRKENPTLKQLKCLDLLEQEFKNLPFAISFDWFRFRFNSYDVFHLNYLNIEVSTPLKNVDLWVAESTVYKYFNM